jgi:hypothetical protein
VDCLRQKDVFEIKTRMTNAASGQGRWKEELGFVDDCVNAGLTPVLLVLFDTDGGSKKKLTELRTKFEAHGRAYVGEEAWVYMEKVAGKAMSIFLTKYVKRPLLELLKESEANTSLTISMDNEGGIEVSDDNHQMDLINRYVKSSER